MAELWESVFAEKQLMWGLEPVKSALFARDYFVKKGVKDVLIPGIGYGRNAKPFLDSGMSVTGIEISETAIALARSKLGLEFPIHHGSVEQMPFDAASYDGIFCYGLIYLLNAEGREKLLDDCHRQLAPRGHMIFTVIAKEAPMYGQGTKLGDDWYEIHPGLKLYFFDQRSIERDFGPHGLVEVSRIDEPMHTGASFPFFNVVCENG